MGTISLLLIEDHVMMREGLRSIFENDDNFIILGEANNGLEALHLLRKKSVDVVLTDINMPVMDGVEFMKKVRQEFPNQAVIALTMLGENQHIKLMLKAGANGYLLKNCGTRELKMAIEKVHNGEKYFANQVTEAIMQNLSGQISSSVDYEIPLSKREHQVLHLIMKEFSNQEIADKLFISTRTVEAHKRNLLDKIGAKNIAGLVKYALDKRLFEDI